MIIIDTMMAIANFLWGWPLLILTFSVALILSIQLKFFQFREFGHAMKSTLGSARKKSDGKGDVSPFQACCTALASTLGVGNIAGVAVAITVGGPGAVFWMWFVALLGLLVKFSEITLATAYRVKDPVTGMWRGGFYWYVRRGLGENWKWLGIVWSFTLMIGMAFAPAIQVNSIVGALSTSYDFNPLWVGIISAALMALILLGGIKSISKFAELVVPFMAIAYTLVSIYVLVVNFERLPATFMMIFEYAFSPVSASGGFAGATVLLAIRSGLARGVFANEAGTGLAPLAHASATVNHPVKQGLWGIVEVFVCSFIVCTMSALVVLCTGVWDNGTSGGMLTTMAFGSAFGNMEMATIFVSAVLIFFAFTTALVNVYYGEICLSFLGWQKLTTPYRLLGCAFAIIGSVGALSILWHLFDFFYGVCAVCNLVVLFAMRKQVSILIKDYLTRRAANNWTETSEEAVELLPELTAREDSALEKKLAATDS